jgi:cell division protein FtsW
LGKSKISVTDKPDEDDYQIEAKIAIASGKIYGLGPGKSVQKNFYHNPPLILFMRLVEEYGLIGGFGVLILYLLLLFVDSWQASRLLESWSSLDLGFQ